MNERTLDLLKEHFDVIEVVETIEVNTSDGFKYIHKCITSKNNIMYINDVISEFVNKDTNMNHLFKKVK